MTLAEDETIHITQCIDAWAEVPPLEKSSLFQPVLWPSYIQRVKAFVEVLPFVMQEATLSNAAIELLYEKMNRMVKLQLPAFHIAIGVVGCSPERSSEISSNLRVGMTSDDNEVAWSSGISITVVA